MMGSARLREHPRLTVSTEQGMLHYALQPATGLLFLAITHPDMPQSAAFGFLEAFKNEVARHPTFSHLLRTKVRVRVRVGVRVRVRVRVRVEGCGRGRRRFRGRVS